jgi:hypothetical protein
MFDGQIGDAAARIELVGRRERLGGADLQTGAAGAAMIRLRRVGREIEREEDLAEEEPGAEALRDEIGVLALPADAGARRQRLLHDRRGVDEHLELAGPLLRRPTRQRLQPQIGRAHV